MASCHIRILSRDDINLVHTKTLELLDKPGVKVQSAKALDVLEEGGAEIDRKTMIARLSESLVKETMNRLPKEVTLAARNPKQDMVAPRTGPPYIATNGTAVYVADSETKVRRASMGRDLKDFMVLCDALEPLDYVWPIVAAHDGPVGFHALNEMVICVQNTTKHVQGEAMSGAEAREMIRVGEIIAGGKDELAKRPIFSVVQCPICPLEFEKGSADAVVEFARAGIPVVSMSMALCGLTAPVTLASAITIVNAENLASFAISQMSKAGAPVIYSSESSVMDMRTGEIRYGAMEQLMIAAGVAQMAKRYGAPTMIGSFGVGISGDMPGIDSKVSELTFDAMTNLTLTDFSSGVGGLDQAKGASLEQCIIDTDIWESIRDVRRDVSFDDEHFAAELIASVGPGGNFLKSPHTARNMRKELFLPDSAKSALYELYRLSGDQKSMVEQARERVRKILSSHKPEPIPREAKKGIDQILASHS